MANSGGVPIVINQDNLNELAVRLGSPNRLYRTGKVFFQDDFSNGLEAWVRGTDISWSAKRSYQSGFSCNIGRVLGITGLSRYDHTFVNPKGFEFSFHWEGILPTSIFAAGMEYHDAVGLQHRAIVNFQGGAYWVNSANANVINLVPVPNLYANDVDFHVVKMVVDFEKRTFLSLNINGISYDSLVVDKPLWSLVAPFADSSPAFRTGININNFGAGINNTYIGHVILTDES
jgi:hypothetical protein